jgi:hypothetical protein
LVLKTIENSNLMIAQSWENCITIKISLKAKHSWLTPVIPATSEADARRIKVQGQPWEIIHEIPSPK